MEDLKKERHGCVNFWLWLVVIVNVICAGAFSICLFGGDNIGEVWAYAALAIFSMGMVLGSILLFRWNKLGFYIFIVASLGSSLAMVAANITEPYSITSSVFTILIWWAILHIKKNGVAAWKLMSLGWDYRHCRHIYECFLGVVILICVLATIASFGFNSSSSNLDDEDYAVAVDTISIEEGMDETWTTYYATDSVCSIQAPSDFRSAEVISGQILGLVCSDYDPAVYVTRESLVSVKKVGIYEPKDYAYVTVKNISHGADVSDYKKISETQYGKNSYLISYALTTDGSRFFYNLLITKTNTYFYSCTILCMNEYRNQLDSKMSDMLKSFKVLK